MDCREILNLWLKRMKSKKFTSKECLPEKFENFCLEEKLDSEAPILEPFPDLKSESFVIDGVKDENGLLDGNCSLFFQDGSIMKGTWFQGVRSGNFHISTNRNGLKTIEGNYSKDELNGIVTVKYSNDTWIEGIFSKGSLHGFCRHFSDKDRLSFLGYYFNGKPSGTCWKIIDGGGCVVGKVDTEGKLTGSDIAYLYPDFETALIGSFENGMMVNARQCSVIGTATERGCLQVPMFSDPTGPSFCREIASASFVTSQPMLKDPYETKLIKVRPSKLQGAAEGLFARADIGDNVILAFYNGIRLPSDYDEEDTWEENAYKIFDPANKPDGALDILEKHRSTSFYNASLAHKVNHSFEPNCQFLVFDHPRWGLIPCIGSTRHIDACEEIFVRYGYDLDLCPEWYLEAWKKGTFKYVEAKNSYLTLDDIMENGMDST